MRTCTALASIVLISILISIFAAGTARAERPPQTRDEADHVVTGVIEKIEAANSDFGGGTKTDYKATLRVTKVDLVPRGSRDAAGAGAERRGDLPALGRRLAYQLGAQEPAAADDENRHLESFAR